jgi:LacI family gluconate utilization system Gnt-I transcriptional repressor
MGNTGFSPQVEEELIDAFLSRRPDGLYMTGGMHSPRTVALLGRTRLPVVEGGNIVAAPLDMAVGISNLQAGRAITAHLIAKKFKTIAFIGVADTFNDRTRDRRRGYEQALRSDGRRVEADLIFETGMTMADGAEAIVKLLSDRPDIDAVVTALDFLAAGAVFECRRRGWAVPQRVAITGFGDLDIASQIEPRLTTVRIPGYQIGTTAARLLCDRLAGRHVRENIVDLGFEIVTRESA